MVRSTLCRCVALAVLVAVLLAPATASAASWLVSPDPAESQGLLASVWDLLRSLFLSETTDTGPGIDPNGAPAVQGDTGCAIDPDGRPFCGPAQ